MRDNVKQIKYGTILSYCLLGVNISLGLIYTPWILRTIGESDYGLYTLATSLISMFLMDFGMSASVTRFVALYRAEGDTEKSEQLLGIIYRIYMILTIIILVVLIGVFFFLDVLYRNLTVDELVRFRVVYIIAGISMVFGFPFNTLTGIFNAYEEFVVVKGIEMATKLLTVVLTIAALLLGGGLYELVSASAFVTIGMTFVKLHFIKTRIGLKVNFRYRNKQLMGELFGFSIWSALQSFGQSFIFNIVPSILAMVANTTAITMFGFVNVLEGYVDSIAGAFNGMFLPMASRISISKDKDDKDKETLSLMVRVGRISQSIILLLLIGLFSQGREFVHLWLGEQYDDVYIGIIMISVTYLISASQQIGNNMIMAENMIKDQAIITLVTGVVNMVLVYILGDYMGMIGAVISITIVQILRLIGNNFIYARKLHINMRKFFRECQIKLFPASLLTVIFVILANKLFALFGVAEGWIPCIAKCIVTGAIYMIVMWMCGWNQEEKTLIKTLLRK